MNVLFSKQEDKTLKVTAFGAIDSVNAPDFLNQVTEKLPGIIKLVIDLKNVDYCSSAGLRSLLVLNDKMAELGGMKMTGANEILMKVFNETGLNEVFTLF